MYKTAITAKYIRISPTEIGARAETAPIPARIPAPIVVVKKSAKGVDNLAAT